MDDEGLSRHRLVRGGDGLEEDALRAKVFRYANAMWRYRTCALRLAYMKAKRTIKLL